MLVIIDYVLFLLNVDNWFNIRILIKKNIYF